MTPNINFINMAPDINFSYVHSSNDQTNNPQSPSTENNDQPRASKKKHYIKIQQARQELKEKQLKESSYASKIRMRVDELAIESLKTFRKSNGEKIKINRSILPTSVISEAIKDKTISLLNAKIIKNINNDNEVVPLSLDFVHAFPIDQEVHKQLDKINKTENPDIRKKKSTRDFDKFNNFSRKSMRPDTAIEYNKTVHGQFPEIYPESDPLDFRKMDPFNMNRIFLAGMKEPLPEIQEIKNDPSSKKHKRLNENEAYLNSKRPRITPNEENEQTSTSASQPQQPQNNSQSLQSAPNQNKQQLPFPVPRMFLCQPSMPPPQPSMPPPQLSMFPPQPSILDPDYDLRDL